MKRYKPLFKEEVIGDLKSLEFTKTYHGTTSQKLPGGLKLSKSENKNIFGGNASISVTDNKFLAQSFTKGELGLDPEGKIFIITKPIKVLDLRDKKTHSFWKNSKYNPQIILNAGYDGVAFENLEEIRIESFYKEIPINKIKNALEIQLFKNVEERYIKELK
jgi:hypothetical protein